MRRPLVALTALLPACVLALASYAGNASTPQGNPQRQSVSVVLDWTPNTNHSGVYLAMARGCYEQEGIDVDILPYSEAGPAPVLPGGRADFVFEGAYSVTSGRTRGDEMTMVFNLQQQSSQGIAVRADNTDIIRPADLDGKLFAIWGAVEGVMKVQTVIRNGGGQGNVETALLGTSAHAAIYNGTADHAEGLTTWEGVRAELASTPLKWLMPADYGVETTPAELGLVTTPAYPRDHIDLAKRFTRATQRGYKDAIADPSAAVDAFISTNPDAAIDRELASRSQELLSSKCWQDSSESVGHGDPARWQGYINYLLVQGLLEDMSGASASAPLLGTDVVSNDLLE